MSSGPSALLFCLETLHGVAVIGWLAGQLWLWRLHAHPAITPQGATLLRGMTTLAATVTLCTGAGLIAP